MKSRIDRNLLTNVAVELCYIWSEVRRLQDGIYAISVDIQFVTDDVADWKAILLPDEKCALAAKLIGTETETAQIAALEGG